MPNRLMMLWDAIRNPTSKPAVNQDLDRRLDAVDMRLDRLDNRDRAVAEAYQRGDAAFRRK